MKRILLLLPVLLLLFAGCKKEKNTGPPVDLYAENEALINTNAKGYLIADVEGLPGVTKLNWQSPGYHISMGTGKGWCSTGSCRYYGTVGNSYTGESYTFMMLYNGMGETREQLLKEEYTTFLENKAEGYGLQLSLQPNGASGAYYTTLSAGNKSVDWAEATLVEAVQINSESYYVKIHFSCQLKDDVTGNIITLKNGVARIKL